MRPYEMTVGRALLDLEDHGSDRDLVIFQGREIEASGLPYRDDRMAKDVRIGYWARGYRFVARGTLSGMVADRRLGRHLSRRPRPRHRPHRQILSDLVDAFALEFAPDGHVDSIAYPAELRELAREAYLSLGRVIEDDA